MKRLVAIRNTLLIAMFATLSIPESANATTCSSLLNGACTECVSAPYVSNGQQCVYWVIVCFNGLYQTGTSCGLV